MKIRGHLKPIIRPFFLVTLLVVVPLARSQTITNFPLPAPVPTPVPVPPLGFTNLFNNLSNSLGWGTNIWWTNTTTVSNVPPRGATNNAPGHSVAPGASAPAKSSTAVQAIVEQFQKERTQLIKDLNSADDSQRQQILQQLEALRQQLIEQVQNLRANLSQQTLEMQAQFANQFGPISRGPGTTSGGGGGSSTGSGGGIHKK